MASSISMIFTMQAMASGVAVGSKSSSYRPRNRLIVARSKQPEHRGHHEPPPRPDLETKPPQTNRSLTASSVPTVRPVVKEKSTSHNQVALSNAGHDEQRKGNQPAAEIATGHPTSGSI